VALFAAPPPLGVSAGQGGAHFYGFPSPGSDYDLRRVHVLPLDVVVGLEVRDETVEVIDGLGISLKQTMKASLEVINRMEADGLIGGHAIGGAVGATFYLEPVATLDIDIFVSFQKGGLISLSPIYDCLTAQGYKTEGD
jgi:hypothetical protein